MILSGHTHTFQTFDFAPARPPQLIIGNSGDNLASQPTTVPGPGMLIGGATVVDTTSVSGFGFSTISPSPDGSWTVVSKDSTGTLRGPCNDDHLQQVAKASEKSEPAARPTERRSVTAHPAFPRKTK
jgi:hypothetical protein